MIPVCVSRCEDCTKVQCIVRPGCGEQHDLGIGIGQPMAVYDVYFTNLITEVTRVYRITASVSGEILFDMQGAFPFLTGRLFRVVAVEVGEEEAAELEFQDGTTFTCAEVEFKNLYDSNGQLECPAIQWLTPY